MTAAPTLPGIGPALVSNIETTKPAPAKRQGGPSVEERFWSKVDKPSGPDACWLWTASVTRSTGRGQFHPNRQKCEIAHRFAYKLAHGEITPGKIVLHRRGCHKLCCRPEHLRLGTRLENTADARAEGKLRGHRLNASQVSAILTLRTQKPRDVIAARFGVSPQSIDNILSGRSWRHVTGITPRTRAYAQAALA